MHLTRKCLRIFEHRYFLCYAMCVAFDFGLCCNFIALDLYITLLNWFSESSLIYIVHLSVCNISFNIFRVPYLNWFHSSRLRWINTQIYSLLFIWFIYDVFIFELMVRFYLIFQIMKDPWVQSELWANHFDKIHRPMVALYFYCSFDKHLNPFAIATFCMILLSLSQEKLHRRCQN